MALLISVVHSNKPGKRQEVPRPIQTSRVVTTESRVDVTSSRVIEDHEFQVQSTSKSQKTRRWINWQDGNQGDNSTRKKTDLFKRDISFVCYLVKKKHKLRNDSTSCLNLSSFLHATLMASCYPRLPNKFTGNNGFDWTVPQVSERKNDKSQERVDLTAPQKFDVMIYKKRSPFHSSTCSSLSKYPSLRNCPEEN